MSSASGLLGPRSEQPHNSSEAVASHALVITRIFAPMTLHPRTARAVFVTPVTPECRRHLCAPPAGPGKRRIPRLVGSDQWLQRGTALSQTPPFGRRVIEGKGSGRSFCASRTKRCAIVARMSTVSIMAKRLPMQTRGPPPNGM